MTWSRSISDEIAEEFSALSSIDDEDVRRCALFEGRMHMTRAARHRRARPRSKRVAIGKATPDILAKAKAMGIPRSTIRYRMDVRGWSAKKALSAPFTPHSERVKRSSTAAATAVAAIRESRRALLEKSRAFRAGEVSR